tara:strand:+ start:309 stop:1220 length:912 start_codon:yes stop_codon:yes gene_type:complete
MPQAEQLKEEELEVEIEETPQEVAKEDEVKAEPEKDEVDSESGAEEGDLEGYSDKVKKRIEKLTYKIREAERREQAATQFAQSMKQENDDLKARTDKIDESYVNEYDQRVTNEEATLKRQLQDAINEGNVDAQVTAQKSLARLAIEEERLKLAKDDLEKRKNGQAEQPKQPLTQKESIEAAKQQDPKLRSWTDKNTWFGDDEPMTLTAFSIHNKLRMEGYAGTEDTYYEELDKRMREEWPHKFANAESTSAPVRTPVAPASRTASGTAKKNKITLTKSQVAIADKLGVSYTEYAKQLEKLRVN